MITDEVRAAGLDAFNEHGIASVNQLSGIWTCRCGTEFPEGGMPEFSREQMRPHVLDAILGAVEPLIRKQTLKEELSLGAQWQVDDPRMSYVDVQVDKDTYIEVFGKDGGY